MPSLQASEPRGRERATYLTLIGLFWGLFLAFLPRRAEKKPLKLRPVDLALLGLATFRLGRLVSYDQVTQPIREPFTETEPDESGAGETTVSEGEGARKALGELISCPTCVGTWAAALLVYGLRVAPGPTRLFLAMMAATGLAELLNSAAECLTWTGRAARVRSA